MNLQFGRSDLLSCSFAVVKTDTNDLSWKRYFALERSRWILGVVSMFSFRTTDSHAWPVSTVLNRIKILRSVVIGRPILGQPTVAKVEEICTSLFHLHELPCLWLPRSSQYYKERCL